MMVMMGKGGDCRRVGGVLMMRQHPAAAVIAGDMDSHE